MAAWLKYLKERFPIVVYFILVGGFVISGAALAQVALSLQAIGAFVALLLFFFVLRLMDEVKDYHKDLIANPSRPLPRGEISLLSAKRGIRIGVLIMVMIAGFISLNSNSTAGFLYLSSTFYLWLMYKEFYVGQWLEKRMLLYAITHQIILLLLCAFAVTFFNEASFYVASTYYYGFAVLGAFFSYEVCRKLDPSAHPILRTYLHEYGYFRSWLIVVGLSALAIWASLELGLKIWPLNILLSCGFLILFKKPEKFKWVELLATISLVAHIWSMLLGLKFY